MIEELDEVVIMENEKYESLDVWRARAQATAEDYLNSLRATEHFIKCSDSEKMAAEVSFREGRDKIVGTLLKAWKDSGYIKKPDNNKHNAISPANDR